MSTTNERFLGLDEAHDAIDDGLLLGRVSDIRQLADAIERDGCCAHRKEAVRDLRLFADLLNSRGLARRPEQA